jgi:ribose 5-phosphate isomerase A
MDAIRQKRAAADYAAELVQDGMIVGLGSGSTAAMMVDALGRRHQQGLQFVGVATSRETADLARSYDIRLMRLDEFSHLDLTIDGADEVAPNLDLTKGGGGQLLREKLVATAARRFVVIVDQSKLVRYVGERVPIPVEVVSFGWTTTAHRLSAVGIECHLRGGETPFTTSNHNYILDCRAAGGVAVAELADRIKSLTGVVDHGLFLGIATTVVVGVEAGGVEILGQKQG